MPSGLDRGHSKGQSAEVQWVADLEGFPGFARYRAAIEWRFLHCNPAGSSPRRDRQVRVYARFLVITRRVPWQFQQPPEETCAADEDRTENPAKTVSYHESMEDESRRAAATEAIQERDVRLGAISERWGYRIQR